MATKRRKAPDNEGTGQPVASQAAKKAVAQQRTADKVDRARDDGEPPRPNPPHDPHTDPVDKGVVPIDDHDKVTAKDRKDIGDGGAEDHPHDPVEVEPTSASRGYGRQPTKEELDDPVIGRLVQNG